MSGVQSVASSYFCAICREEKDKSSLVSPGHMDALSYDEAKDEISFKVTELCQHYFCEECLTLWRKKNINCPMCRRNYFFIHKDEKISNLALNKFNFISGTDLVESLAEKKNFELLSKVLKKISECKNVLKNVFIKFLEKNDLESAYNVALYMVEEDKTIALHNLFLTHVKMKNYENAYRALSKMTDFGRRDLSIKKLIQTIGDLTAVNILSSHMEDRDKTVALQKLFFILLQKNDYEHCYDVACRVPDKETRAHCIFELTYTIFLIDNSIPSTYLLLQAKKAAEYLSFKTMNSFDMDHTLQKMAHRFIHLEEFELAKETVALFVSQEDKDVFLLEIKAIEDELLTPKDSEPAQKRNATVADVEILPRVGFVVKRKKLKD